MSSVFDNFSALDELTQIIYQSAYKFVVHSNVDSNGWTVHVGVSGLQLDGRWWRGRWTEADIHDLFGTRLTDEKLETFADKLAQVFIKGDVCITGWSAQKGAAIKFTLGPEAKRPMHVPLVELEPHEAAAYTTRVFLEIAVQAQSRNCRLYPSATDITSTSTPNATSSGPAHVPSKRRMLDEPEGPSKGAKSSSLNVSVKEDKEMKTQHTSQSASTAAEPEGKPTVSATPRPPTNKGSSLANPAKKARKIKAIEFESDEES